jgi:DNA repair and recombination protein RAD52
MNLKENSVAKTLEKKLGSEWISKRSGPGGSTISYIEGWKAIQLANEIFGYNGWNHSVVDITIDYVDVDGTKVSCGISATVRVTLRDGTYHEDVGYGSIDNARTKGIIGLF